jgi:hypothetical protein
MSSSNLKRSVLVETATQAIPESHSKEAVKCIPDTALTVRAMVLVAFVGAVICYLLWETSFHFLVRH